ncbi:mRNA cleavage and polyadenylation specificity factor-like protein [Natrinema sp. 1APR25-10V2]|uniref:mRNA cleavage and polyadenylation specificity factor-like protein n=1 Tax=Natrinema sp. 1APR25-10V2 TaxID=2951081 RepID=UPI0028762EB6|nr:mRNA cleavage and polyadenylation specificity factor-like protein [Natrinema sp. 1APR25-10V2]MDS0478468.1 mRNA cleavage and polyadenylation specificity factor-like protein [Natrinema sp. 1APR25-10V2]
MTVRHRDGIHFEFQGESRVVADARSAVGAVNVVSHAHADHTFRTTPETVVCSAETAAIAEARTGTAFEFVERTPGIELVPAGHVVGSRAAIVDLEAVGGTDGGDGIPAEGPRRFCYTGDFSIRDRCYLEGFDPHAVAADALVMETTYGLPKYRFSPQEELEAAIADWLRDNDERPLFLFGYSLGRAQKLQWLARDATDGGREILVSDSIHDVNRAIERATDGSISFSGQPYESLRGLGDELVVLPSNQARADWVETAVDREDGLKAGFSGWAVDDSFRYRGNYDVAFPLTDHCDFDELVETVRAIDPEVVYTQHGFDEAFADHLATEYGYRARPLKRDQTTLEEFC